MVKVVRKDENMNVVTNKGYIVYSVAFPYVYVATTSNVMDDGISTLTLWQVYIVDIDSSVLNVWIIPIDSFSGKVVLAFRNIQASTKVLRYNYAMVVLNLENERIIFLNDIIYVAIDDYYVFMDDIPLRHISDINIVHNYLVDVLVVRH